jgi:hypothetical protein
MYLVDTNILIAYFEGNTQITTLLNRWMKNRCLRLSCIVAAEFLIKAKTNEQKALWRMAEQFPIVYLDQQILLKAVDLRKKLLLKKNRIVMLDCFIVATAMVNGWTLVTRNARDFRSISGLKLRVV